MRPGIVGAVLVALAGGAAGGAVFLRDTAALGSAKAARDQGLAKLAEGDLPAAREKMSAAIEAAAQVGAATGRLAEAQAVGTEALRWWLVLDALEQLEVRPAEALAQLEADGKALGKELPAPLQASIARVRAERALEAGLALERNRGLDQAPRLLELALPALEAAASPRLPEAKDALERARLRQGLRDAEAALAGANLSDAATAAERVAPGLAADPGPGWAAEELASLRERLARVQAEQADRSALLALDARLQGLVERVTGNDLGKLLPEVRATSLPELRGGYPAAEEVEQRRDALATRREKLLEVATAFQDMVLAVRLSDRLVFVDRTEVTNAGFAELVASDGYSTDGLWTPEGLRLRERFKDATRKSAPAGWKNAAPPEGREQHPVTGVSFHEAAAYARFRGKRLPTLAEWQGAAIPVPTSDQPWPWGTEWRQGAANVSGDGPGTTEPVGSRPDGAGPSGALDVIGNVSEIVSRDADHVAVGGSFGSLQRQATAQSTRALQASLRAPDTGFRCAKELPLPWDG